MDAVVYKALEEICSQGLNGLTLRDLWPKLNPHISSNLSSDVKRALWSNIINLPSLRFECEGVKYDARNPKIQSVEDSEAMELRIVAAEHLLDSFVGIYDIKASDAAVSKIQRRVLERLAIARTDGVAQHDLCKEVGKNNNDMYYVLRQLETRGLIVRQSAMIRKKVAGNEEHKNGSIVNTNMVYLYRYAKHLGRLQRLEITKEDKALTDNDDEDKEVATGDGVSEQRVNNYVPAFRAICDRLEKADGKVLVVSDIKRELGYRKTQGHRAWRNILNKLKDASIVEEFFAKVNNKDVNCLRLLKKFSPETFMSKGHGGGDDDHVKPVKRGQITEQLFELPIEQQIYDMIDAEGSKGLTLNEVFKRLGINNKRYYPRVLEMVSRFKMHIDSEGLNRGSVYRVWTCGNYNAGAPNTPPSKPEYSMTEKLPTHAQAGQLMLTHTMQNADDKTTNVDAEAGEEQSNNPVPDDKQNAANDIVPDAELQIVTVKPPPNPVSLEISSSDSPANRKRRSYTAYPCIGFKSVSSLREQRILEKLQEEKFFIQPELQRLLDSVNNLDKKQSTTMDKKTLDRSLNKLQQDGHCKCITFGVPSLTNIGRKRTVEVILHPSVYDAEDLSDRVHDRLRLFEKQLRVQSSLKHKVGKCNKSIPVLNVERINTGSRIDYSQAETCEAMKNNGFVLAKMVRAKLLHVFLWGYLTGLPGWDDAIKDGYEQKNVHSSCKLFEIGEAVKAMPLELFLQVAGSSLPLESLVEKCRKGLRLSDLPVDEYRCLMDTRATGRISILIDILRRLKLIRLIGGDIPVGPHTTLSHSLELKPYIEEPVGMVLPYTSVNSFDLRPQVRHDFVLASKISVDEYWSTLEYCYAASDPKAALHAFPGSTVHEVYHARAWASARVMTAHQRAELFKLVANEDLDKKISFKKCEKIAENLHLTLEQVLRVFYDKRQKFKSKLALTHASSPLKRKKSSKRKSPVNNDNDNPFDEESGKVKQAKIANNATKEQKSLQRLIDEIDEANMLINEIDGQNQKDAVDDDLALNQDENGDPCSGIHDCVLSKLQSSRQKRFAWTEDKDRQLVITFAKHRVALGAKFHRVEWAALPNLPGPPDTCRRRMALLNRNTQFRKALMRLCNMLSVRYAIHLDASKNKSLGDNCKVIVKDHAPIDHTNDMNTEERWDDFDNKDIQTVLNEVLKYKQIAKLEAPKGARYNSTFGRSDGGESHELDENNLSSSSTPTNELKKDGGKRQVSARRSRSRLSKSYIKLMNKVKDFGTQAYKSLAVSNAIELFKLIFLSASKAPEGSVFLAETLRRYSEHDLFTAFNYLKDKNFMVRGSDIGEFVLSRQFLRNISSSPFPEDTGKGVGKMSRWLHERENDLLDNGVDLPADLQCGEVIQLCVLMCTGEISMFPCLPHEGIGEIEELKKRKCDDNEIRSAEITKKPKLLDNETFTRKDKGFPGIQLSVSRRLISRVDEITSVSNLECASSSSGRMEGVLKSNGASESTWEAMTCYARHLVSSAELSPDLFSTVYSAIHKSGDQGLRMEEISRIIDVLGENMPELVVEVLEVFGRALKVNAYDSVHVVDSLYRSKYMLTSMPSHQHDLHLKAPESYNTSEPPNLQQENRENISKKLVEVISTDVDEVQHRVTILNHLEEVLVPQPMSEVNKSNEIKTVTGSRKGPQDEKCEFRMDDSSGSYKPILPWVNGDGTVNKIVYKGLVRRVLGIVMQNPGILEEHIISQMNVLNPQSCRKLLELMILDSHITVRKMYQSISNDPPAMLHRLLGSSSSKKPKLICREHLFANPKSINYL
ncbi:putative B-block binding subunit of TFIIIC, tfc3, extended winged-helix domain-containing protein [Helianthus annuus]|nr:putative B-block binding subunit of TFIIIC, tfc3, extended winged-helix domain-containing protein [Helianthus annuus]KAJ0884301.1 putative B-block binding subunit of TFIIIC, tfc3, extended winged-helix domain-containing protein [Helianthus annuus]